MKTVREHLASVHKMHADDVANLSEHHARCAGLLLKAAASLRDNKPGEAASSCEQLAREYSSRAATELNLSKHLADLSSELGDTDADVAAHNRSSDVPRAGLVNQGDDNGDNGNDKVAKLAPDGARDRIRPDGVRGTMPGYPGPSGSGLTLVPRAGGPPAPETQVDPQFAHLVKVNEEL